MAPTIRMAAISSEVATGRRMYGRDGFMAPGAWLWWRPSGRRRTARRSVARGLPATAAAVAAVAMLAGKAAAAATAGGSARTAAAAAAARVAAAGTGRWCLRQHDLGAILELIGA